MCCVAARSSILRRSSVPPTVASTSRPTASSAPVSVRPELTTYPVNHFTPYPLPHTAEGGRNLSCVIVACPGDRRSPTGSITHLPHVWTSASARTVSAGCGSDDQDCGVVVESTDRTSVMIVCRMCCGRWGQTAVATSKQLGSPQVQLGSQYWPKSGPIRESVYPQSIVFHGVTVFH